MKMASAIALALFILAPAAQAQSLCGEKEQDIQRQISHAEQQNHHHRVQGLKKALSEVQANCTDSKLVAEHQEKIARHKAKVAERQAELSEARQKGDPEKIAKREKKLAEAEAGLKALEKRQY